MVNNCNIWTHGFAWLTLAVIGSGRLLPAGEAEQAFAVAAGHYSKGRWQTALAEFERFLSAHQQHPLSRSVPFFQGEAAHQLQQYGAAHFFYKTYLSLGHDRYVSLARFRMGECSLLSQRWEPAIGELRQFLAIAAEDSKNCYAYLYLGQAYLEAEQFEASRDAYLRALETFAAQTSVAARDAAAKCRYGLGQTLQQLGRADEARRFYSFLAASDSAMADDALLQIVSGLQSAGRHAQAVGQAAEFRRRFRDSPLAARAALTAARSHLALEHPEQAARLLHDAAERFAAGKQAGADKQFGATLLYEAARASWLASQPEQAAAAFRRLIDQWPDSDWTDEALHSLILMSDDLDETARFAEQLLDAHPQSPLLDSARLTWGERLVSSGRYGQAVDVLTRRSSQGQGDAAYLLMLAQLGAGEANDALKTAGRIDSRKLDAVRKAGLLSARAAALFSSQQYEQAVEPLREYLEQHPDGPQRQRRAAQYAVCLAHLSQLPAAVEALRLLPAESTLYPAAARFVAAKAMAAGQWQPAAELLETLAKRPQAAVADRCQLAKAWLQDGRDAAARQLLDQLWQTDPLPRLVVETTLLLGQQWQRSGDVARSEPCLVWVGKQQQQDLSQQARLLLGRAWEQAGRDEEAVEVLQQLAALDNFHQQAAAAYHLGWALQDLGRTQQARETFARLAAALVSDETAVGLHSDEDRTLARDAAYRLASWELQDRQLESAAARLEQLAAELPADHRLAPHVRILRGHVAAAQRDWAAARTWFAGVATDAPQLAADAKFLAGESLFRQRKYAGAEQQLSAALAATVDSGGDAQWLPTAQLRLAQIMAHGKQWTRAEAAALQLQRDVPDYPRMFEVHYLLGRCLASQARFHEARESYAHCAADPAAQGAALAAKAQWMIGETYFHQQNYAEAIRAYHKVELLYRHPTWQSLALLQAGKCHEAEGRVAEARQLYQQVLHDFPQSRAAEQARLRTAPVKTAAAPPATDKDD